MGTEKKRLDEKHRTHVKHVKTDGNILKDFRNAPILYSMSLPGCFLNHVLSAYTMDHDLL